MKVDAAGTVQDGGQRSRVRQHEQQCEDGDDDAGQADGRAPAGPVVQEGEDGHGRPGAEEAEDAQEHRGGEGRLTRFDEGCELEDHLRHGVEEGQREGETGDRVDDRGETSLPPPGGADHQHDQHGEQGEIDDRAGLERGDVDGGAGGDDGGGAQRCEDRPRGQPQSGGAQAPTARTGPPLGLRVAEHDGQGGVEQERQCHPAHDGDEACQHV